ncbi:hypothetical protein Tsubulata_033923 [Turnera subulata]|uniref:non-specific serine/threonine protein kinase n=1 Tax=Turnera subulata TaxID=218843 RepID=A0A9Q0JPP4_9ROSI|nr:hypothetical protein Tsubulata_033923 [Turnera subulata]
MGLHNLFCYRGWLYSRFVSIFFCLSVKSVLSADFKYEHCKPKTCGFGPSISYPFHILDNGTDYCGHQGFSVRCDRGLPVFKTWLANLIIKSINYEQQSFRLVDVDVMTNAACPSPSQNYSFGRSSSLSFVPYHTDIYFFYSCNDSFSVNYTYSELKCNSSSTRKTFVALVPRDEDVNWSRSAYEYSLVAAPVQLGEWAINQTITNLDYIKFLQSRFTLKWMGLGFNCGKCQSSGGRCGFLDERETCYCPDGQHSKHCYDDAYKVKVDHISRVVLVVVSWELKSKQ